MNKNGFLTNLFGRIFMVVLLSLMVYGCHSKHSSDANTPTNYMFATVRDSSLAQQITECCHSKHSNNANSPTNYMFATVRNSSLAQQITEFSEHAKIYGYRKLLSLTINCINQDTIQYKLASINGFWMLDTDIAIVAKVNDIYVLVRINPINDFSLPGDTTMGGKTPTALVELLRHDYPKIYDEYLEFKNTSSMTAILSEDESWTLTYVKDSLISREKPFSR